MTNEEIEDLYAQIWRKTELQGQHFSGITELKAYPVYVPVAQNVLPFPVYRRYLVDFRQVKEGFWKITRTVSDRH